MRIVLEGFTPETWVEVDPDPEWGALEDLQSGTMAGVRQALACIVQGWNLVDKQGRPLPSPSQDAQVVRRVSLRQMTALMEAVAKALTTASKSGPGGFGGLAVDAGR